MFSFLTLCWEKDELRCSALAVPQWLLLLLMHGHSGLSRALGTPRCSWSLKSHSWPLQEWFLIPFFRTRPKIVPCPASDWLTDWAPSVLVNSALSVQVSKQPLMLPSFLASYTWEFKLLLISAFLPSGPWMLYQGSCHEHLSRLITFHLAKLRCHRHLFSEYFIRTSSGLSFLHYNTFDILCKLLKWADRWQ